MSNQTAHLQHDDHDQGNARTIREWSEITRRKPDSVMKTVRRKLGTGYNLDTQITADQFNKLYTQETSAPQARRTKTADTNQQPRANNPEPTNPKPKPSTSNPFPAWRRPILYTLMAMPAIASIQNMYSVTGDIAAHMFTAALLTGLFSATPFLFVLAGIRNHWTAALAVTMIAYECFCNVTRIYGGLTGFGRGDFPTRFLGLVCDFFNSGTYATAKALAILMAAMAAAVFYAAFVELNKKP